MAPYMDSPRGPCCSWLGWASNYSEAAVCDDDDDDQEMAAAAGGGGGAKATVAEQIGQAVQSTSNLLQLMEQSSPAQVHLPLSSSRPCLFQLAASSICQIWGILTGSRC